MSGRTIWMIVATARTWGSSGVASDLRSPPSESRLRLALKVAMRTRPGESAAAAGRTPAAAISIRTAMRRTRSRGSEVESDRTHHRARRADRIETDRSAETGAGADVAEVLLVEQVDHVELQFRRLDAGESQRVPRVEIEHRVTGRDFGVEVRAVTIVHLLGLQADAHVVGDLDVDARAEHPLRRLDQDLSGGRDRGGGVRGRDVVQQYAVVVGDREAQVDEIAEALSELRVETFDFHVADVAIDVEAEFLVERRHDAVRVVDAVQRERGDGARVVEAPAEVVRLRGLGFRRGVTDALVREANDRVQVVRARSRQAFGVRRIERVTRPGFEGDARVRQDLVELDLILPRRDELHRGCHRVRGGRERDVAVRQDRQRRAAGAQRAAGGADGARSARTTVRRVAILVEFAREEGGAQAERRDDLVFREFGAVFDRILIELGDREAIAAANDVAIRGVDAFALAAREYVF